jgi:sigma-B regulation protein RsbU (phosphoserine phosphatase)
LGGDFYDFKQGDDGVVLIVSDVIGHGFQAALTTMLLKATFQETAAVTLEPVSLLTEMNARFSRIFPEGMFAAAAAARLAPDGSLVRLAGAGLPYPFVLRASKERVDELSLPGFPLGLLGRDDPVSYEAHDLTLAPGDVLLMGSDGIGAVSNGNGEHFEDHRLRKVLTELVGHDGQEVIDTLMERAVAFGKARPLPDDIILVAIRRDGGLEAS